MNIKMFTNYTVDDVLETVSAVGQDVSNNFNEVQEICDDLENYFEKLVGPLRLRKDSLSSIERCIDQEYNKQHVFVDEISKNSVAVTNLKNTISDLHKIKAEKECEYSNLQQKVTVSVTELQKKLHTKDAAYHELRDEVLAYKCLTNVEFVYSTEKIEGLVDKENPKPFIFDPQEMSQEEITKKLWELILE